MFERELEVAERLARQAGAILLDVYAGEFAVEMKGESDPVTEADKRANAFLVEALKEAFPGDGIVAEETADQSDASRGGRCWYVDPLDGTREFIARNGEFSVMLGLAVDGEAKVGAVFQPEPDRLYLGAVGVGAWLIEQGTRTPMQVQPHTGSADSLRLVVSRSHRSQRIEALKSALGVTQEQRSGSVGLKLGLIARGEVDFYVHFSDKTCVWDICGPEAVLRGAGGHVSDLQGAPFRYEGAIHNRAGILASIPGAETAVQEAVEKVWDGPRS